MTEQNTKSVNIGPIAIIGGTGDLGPGLAIRLAAAGQSIVIGSRDPERASAAADKARNAVESHMGSTPIIESASNANAAKSCQIIVMTVPFKGQYETLKGLKSSLDEGDVLVDTTSPLETAIGGSPLHTLEVSAGSVAEMSQRLVPEGVNVVSAMQTVSASRLKDLASRLDEDVLICGDDAGANKTFSGAISMIEGLRPVDCGKLEMARVTERMTSMLIGINMRYKAGHAGIRVTGLPETLWK